MTDPVPPKTPKARKWILWGCGCGVLLVVVLSGVFGFAFWRIKKATDELAGIGAAYVAGRPEVSAELGTVRKVEPRPLPIRMEMKDDQGEALFGYTVTGAKGAGEAVVFLVKSAGSWQAVGARLEVGGKAVSIGTPGPDRID
jgi:hypothetical protein